MNQPLYVIGIDGGGTKTTAILCALDGTILSEAQGGPSNFHSVGVQPSAHTIIDLIETCCHSIGCSISQIGAIVAGLAGAGRTSDQQQIFSGILEEAKKRSISFNIFIVESDARCALEGALSGKPGMVVIAGTGSIVMAKDAKGKIFRAGGWGRLIGDDGSGYSIGREAIRAVTKYIDGCGEKTKLQHLVGTRFGFTGQENIIHALYEEHFDMASLAPLVIAAATSGDRIAKNILTDASHDVVRLIQSVLGAMKKRGKCVPTCRLAFTGSLLVHDNWYSRKLRSMIKRTIPSIIISTAESSPIVGAATMAIEFLKKNGIIH